MQAVLVAKREVMVPSVPCVQLTLKTGDEIALREQLIMQNVPFCAKRFGSLYVHLSHDKMSIVVVVVVVVFSGPFHEL